MAPSKTDAILPSLSPDESKVFDALEPYPIHIDDLVRTLFMEPGKLSSILLQLELKGVIKQSPGKFFSLQDNIRIDYAMFLRYSGFAC